ncbi:MAG: hypothetical protein DVB23_001274 [Verrucomicrobia bacterium]|jgi:hypothetical protein|nr:MAG: hypothetical protein DVB23_001274 [Verrucomicrobiota bacterium]
MTIITFGFTPETAVRIENNHHKTTNRERFF